MLADTRGGTLKAAHMYGYVLVRHTRSVWFTSRLLPSQLRA